MQAGAVWILMVYIGFPLATFYLGLGLRKIAPRLNMGLCFLFSAGISILFFHWLEGALLWAVNTFAFPPGSLQ